MKDWVPFFQALIWPLFVGLILIWSRTPLSQLLNAIAARIIAGAEFEAGPTGVKIGAAPKIVDVPAAAQTGHTLAVTSSRALVASANSEALAPKDIYLVHTARRSKTLGDDGSSNFNVRIYLDADEDETLDRVSEVTYYLHPTFKNPVVAVRDRQTSFEVRIRVWGEFNVAAKVHFKDGTDVELERYLNL